jgi:hypothetical protein
MGDDGRFNAEGFDDTVKHVGAFYESLTKEQKLPPDRVFIVGSSGLESTIRSSKKSREEQNSLITKNQVQLNGAILKAVNKEVKFFDFEQELPLQIKGVVRQADRTSALFLNVGGGNTRGGFLDSAGRLKRFDGEGSGTKLAGKKLQEAFRQALDKEGSLRTRKKVYLAGGIVWIMTNYRHPETFEKRKTGDAEQHERYVKLSAGDFKAFAKAMHANEAPEAPLEAYAATLGDQQQAQIKKEMNEEVAKMREKFHDRQKLIAGADVLLALSEELDFEHKELYFDDDGEVAWFLNYVADKVASQK